MLQTYYETLPTVLLVFQYLIGKYLVLQRTFQLYAVRRYPDDADPFSRGDILPSASGAEGSL